MPHCWPQKQHCVFTIRSGSALVDSRMPAMVDWCGPNFSKIFRGSAGIVATSSPRRDAFREPIAPCAALREAEEGASATRTDLLVVLGALLHLVREPEL